MNYDKLKIITNKKKFKIGEIITYKCNSIIKKGLFINYVNENKIRIVLINNRLDEGVKTEIDIKLIL